MGTGKGSAQPGTGTDRHLRFAANVPDMDDSIMRGPGARKAVTVGGVEGAGGEDAAAELAKKFRCVRVCVFVHTYGKQVQVCVCFFFRARHSKFVFARV